MHALALLSALQLAAGATLSLDDALALAARKNADVKIARADLEAAGANVRQAYAGVLPRLDLSGFFGRKWLGANNPSSLRPTSLGSYDLALTLQWTLFDGLSSWNAIASSRASADAASRQLDEASLATAFAVTQRFYEVVKQQQALEVARETAALSAELVKRADALFAAGRGTKADTYSARVNLGNDQIAARAQLAALTRSRSDLAVVLGLTTEAGLEVAAPAFVTNPGPPEPVELPPISALLASAEQHRPILLARRLSRQAADSDVAGAQGAYWPRVGVQASYDRLSSDLGGSSGVFGDLSNVYTATLLLTLDFSLFAGGQTRAGVERALAQARRTRAQLEQAEEVVAAEVTAARAQVEALAGSLATARENLDAAEKALRFARERLEAGVGSQLEVRDANLKLAQAKVTAFDTLVDLVVARADLNRAVGGAL
jgi:outer membrane protein